MDQNRHRAVMHAGRQGPINSTTHTAYWLSGDRRGHGRRLVVHNAAYIVQQHSEE